LEKTPAQDLNYFSDMRISFHTFLFVFSALFASLFAREVPVRYTLLSDSSEHDATFIKLAADTVYLLPLDSSSRVFVQKQDDKLAEKIAPSDSVEEDSLEMGGSFSSSSDAPADVSPVAEAPSSSSAAADDFEAALKASEEKALADSIAKVKAVEDSLRAKAVKDSLAVEASIPIEAKYIRIFKMDFKRLTNLEDGGPVDLSLKDYVFPDSIEEEEPLYPEGKANLFVTTVPDSCELFINGEDLEMASPDTIKNIKPGKYTISVKKQLKNVDWWGTQTVKINGDSLNKIQISVERPKTRLTVATIPDGVEVYLDRQPNESIMPEYLTDVSFETKPSTKTVVYLRKVGYLDTAIVTEVHAFMPNPVYVELEAVDNLSVVEMQREYNTERSHRYVGRGILWSSIAPIIAGGVFWYLAERDWSDAADKKTQYNLSAFESADTQKLVKDNKDLNDSGDKKGLIAAGFGVLGVGLFVAGFVLAF